MREDMEIGRRNRAAGLEMLRLLVPGLLRPLRQITPKRGGLAGVILKKAKNVHISELNRCPHREGRRRDLPLQSISREVRQGETFHGIPYFLSFTDEDLRQSRCRAEQFADHVPGRNEARVPSRPKPNTRSEEKQTQLLSDYVIIFVEINTAGSVSKQRSPKLPN